MTMKNRHDMNFHILHPLTDDFLTHSWLKFIPSNIPWALLLAEVFMTFQIRMYKCRIARLCGRFWTTSTQRWNYLWIDTTFFCWELALEHGPEVRTLHAFVNRLPGITTVLIPGLFFWLVLVCEESSLLNSCLGEQLKKIKMPLNGMQ